MPPTTVGFDTIRLIKSISPLAVLSDSFVDQAHDCLLMLGLVHVKIGRRYFAAQSTSIRETLTSFEVFEVSLQTRKRGVEYRGWGFIQADRRLVIQ